MATVTGTESQNKSKYKFYMTYSTSFSTTKMQWTVSVKVYLLVSYYAYEGWTWHSLSIGGTVVSKKDMYKKACYSNNGSKTFLIASGNKYYSASSKDRDVKLSATMSADSGGWGPGNCKVSKTITLPAKLKATGELEMSSITVNSAKGEVDKIATGLGYTKTVKLYYRRSTSSSYTYLKSVSVSNTDNDMTFSLSKLAPNTKYYVKANIYAPKSILMKTATSSFTTKAEQMTLSVSKVTETSVTIKVSGTTPNLGLSRKVEFYCRVKGASSWGSAKYTASISSAGDANVAYTYKNLNDNQSYEFKVICKSGSTTLCSASTVAKTLLGVPEEDISEVSYSQNTLSFKIVDRYSKLPITNKVVVYVKNHSTIFFVGEQTISFTKEVMQVKYPVIDATLKEVFSGEYSLLILLLEDGSNKVKQIMRTE